MFRVDTNVQYALAHFVRATSIVFTQRLAGNCRNWIGGGKRFSWVSQAGTPSLIVLFIYTTNFTPHCVSRHSASRAYFHSWILLHFALKSQIPAFKSANSASFQTWRRTLRLETKGEVFVNLLTGLSSKFGGITLTLSMLHTVVSDYLADQATGRHKRENKLGRLDV